MGSKISLSIVIPVYNGAKTIGRLVEDLITILKDNKLQIVLVNDASPDNSHHVCEELYQKYSKSITYLNLAKNFGEHNAVMAGLNYAKGDYIVIMDDDFQNPPQEVPRIVNKAVEGNYDLVYTYYKKKQHHWFRNFGSRFTDKVANIMLKKPKNIYLSSFKCINKFLVKEIIKYKGPFPYIDGLALRSTNKIGKILVHHDKREQGKSGYTFRKLIRLWMNMFLNFSIIPLRVSTLLGILFSLLGMILSIAVVIEKVLSPQIPLGWPSLIVAIMIFSGVQLLILGLMGEYVGHLLLSNNQTPQFVVHKVYKSK